MRKCKKCNAKFPWRIIIDGKERLLRNRKHCLECSPFGSHNIKGLESQGKKYSCSRCNRKFTYHRKSGHTKTLCNSCKTMIRKYKVRKKCIKYKGNVCFICGYGKCSDSLHFHHVDPKTKLFTISRNTNRSWESIRRELDKCIMLCANCHGESHVGLIKLDVSMIR